MDMAVSGFVFDTDEDLGNTTGLVIDTTEVGGWT